MALVAIALAALTVAACGGPSSRTQSGSRTHKTCRASVGIEAPTTGPMKSLGAEQLAFAKLAVANDNNAHGTHISLVPGDSGMRGAMALTQQIIANPAIVAVVGPAANHEVMTAGPLFARAGMAFISGSATRTSLTDGANPTFFRVVPKDSVQGPELAHFVITKLHPRTLMVIDDREPYSTGLVSAMIPIFRAAGVTVHRESAGDRVSDFSSLAAKVRRRKTVVVLPWQVAASAQQFGRALVQLHRHATIVGTDRLYSPTFTVRGSYVSSFGPDIATIPADGWLVRQATSALARYGTFGAPVYAATHVVDEAIAAICRSGQTPTRSNVLPAIKTGYEPTSVLGRAIRFDAHGDLINGRWFLFRITSAGRYQLVKGG